MAAEIETEFGFFCPKAVVAVILLRFRLGEFSSSSGLLMLEYLQRIPWSVVILFCLTLGLAPFTPPHIVEKLRMLFQGKLVRPIDWFDLLLHSFPWMILIAKLALSFIGAKRP